MMWRSTRRFVVAATVLLASGSVPGEPDREPVYPASMVSILADPESYSGKQVSVFGYLHADWGLYLTKDHAAASDLPSSFHVSDTDTGEIAASGCMERYVDIVAKFVVRERAPLTLMDVRRVHVRAMERGGRGYDCFRSE